MASAPKSLITGELYKAATNEESWHVELSPLSPDSNYGREDIRAPQRGGATTTDSVSECSNQSDESLDFLKDDKHDMTFGRRIALCLMDKTWYNPRAKMMDLAENDPKVDEVQLQRAESSSASNPKIDDFDATMSNTSPSLEKAWAYFEHVALYRYIVPPKDKKMKVFARVYRVLSGNTKLERAKPGENHDQTRLYSPIMTPHSQLGDFGLGIGLYFSTLRAITFITLLAGLVSIYNIMYFASDEYQPEDYTSNISTFERGSAICTNTAWVPCTDCICADLGEPSIRLGTFASDRCARDPSYPDLTFVLRNLCDGTPWQLAAVNYGSLIVVLLAIFGLGYFLKNEEVKFDLDEQTAQDYSMKISNPPPDAKDPDEWFKFFKENFDAHSTVVTIAVDNDLLVKTLMERRDLLRTIYNNYTHEVGSSMSLLDLARVAAEMERKRNFLARVIAVILPGLPELSARVAALNNKINGFAQLDYRVTNVFVTFETEQDQRNVLSCLSVGSVSSSRNDISALSDSRFLFRGRHVLSVKEPEEPDTIRWQDLNIGTWQKIKEKFLTFLCTMIAIVLVAVMVNLANEASTVGAAFTISAFNVVFPMMAKLLTNLESHSSEGSKQTSLYYKICLFRWVSTSVVISLITPFTSTLTNKTGLITQVYALFFADIVTTNALQLLDPFGHIARHWAAPRAKTQDSMNLLFQGTVFELAERYTDMTKNLLLCLWYSSIFPGVYFLCSISLLIKYCVDRFSLMRTWKRAPQLGNSISRTSRRVFFPLAIVVQAVLSSFYWSGFPYDDICPNDGDINNAYVNTFNLVPVDKGNSKAPTSVTFTNDDVDYHYCNMNMMTLAGGITFPFVPTVSSEETQPSEWMTPEQKISTTYFGWSAVAIICLFGLVFLKRTWHIIVDRFHSTYKAVGSDQGIPFSSVASRSAYIPQVTSTLFAYPLIACNTDNLDEELYDFTDPEREYRFYDLTKDAKKLLASVLKEQEPPGFSRVKHYPPDVKEK